MKKRMNRRTSGESVKSIQTKIVTVIGGIVIIAMVFAGMVIVNLTSKTVTKDESNIARISEEKLVAELNNYFTLYIAVTKQLAHDDNVRNLVEGVTVKSDLKNSPYWNGTYDMLARTKTANAENDFDPFVVDLDAQVGFNGEDWISDDGFDLTTRDYWFGKEADIQKGYIITEPYLDLDTGDQIITVSAPIYNKENNKIIGIAGIDVHTNKINALISQHNTSYKTAKTVLLSRNNVVLASNDKNEILKKVIEVGFSQSMLDDIARPSGEVIQFEDDGVHYYGVTGTIKESGWKVILSIPEKEFLSSVNSTVHTVVIFLLS